MRRCETHYWEMGQSRWTHCLRSTLRETGRGIDVRLRAHKRDMMNDMDHSAFVLHARKTNHLPNWGGASAIPASCRSRQNGKATEAAYIATCETIHIRVGFMKWAKSAEVFGLSTCRCDFYLIHVLFFYYYFNI